ncbi:MAG: hypothetical protein AAB459_02545 [Patescibacteria group bacterium]
MYKHVLHNSSTGPQIYVNLISSAAGHYLSRQPYLINIVIEALDRPNYGPSKINVEYDMGRVIGHSDIVTTNEKDTIFYAKPVKLNSFTRFTKNRNPVPSNTLSLKLSKDDEGNYELFEAWIGPSTPPFPENQDSPQRDKTFWQTHAHVFDSYNLQSKTITKICPY